MTNMLARLTHRVLNPRGLSQLLPVDGELLSVVDENWFIGRSDLGMLALVTVWPQKDPRTARGGQRTANLLASYSEPQQQLCLKWAMRRRE